jgi:flagellar secretion chaperone FliS
MSNGYSKYKKTSIESASKEKILLMLYEGAIRFIKQAKEANINKDVKVRGEMIGRAYDIIMELASSLDFKVNDSVATNLEQLYIYIMEELTRANITGQEKHLDNSLKILNILYDGWVKAVESIKKKESQSA